MSQTTYLITGANRGLGLGMLKALIARPNTTIIAGVRDPTASTSQSLASLPSGSGSKVITVKIDANDDSTPAAAVSELQSKHGIEVIDIVIANAGISNYYGLATITPIQEVNEHYQVNVVGPLTLFQATYPLLKKSKKPMFVPIGTAAASIGDMAKVPMQNAAYGASKAALNFVTVKIHHENPWLIAFPLSPGWVQTDMGNHGAASSGLEKAPTTVDESVSGMVDKIDNATRDKTSGTFVSFDGGEWAW